MSECGMSDYKDEVFSHHRLSEQRLELRLVPQRTPEVGEQPWVGEEP